MNILVTAKKKEWEGMAYIGLTGDVGSFRNLGLGKVASGFREAYVTLTNSQTKKQCGGILKSISSGFFPWSAVGLVLLGIYLSFSLLLKNFLRANILLLDDLR